jgi:predicted DNA-binding transcriptional regulator AlpA
MPIIEAPSRSVCRAAQPADAYPPRLMKAPAASRYVGMSESKFLRLVEAKRLPQPKSVDGLVLWDRLQLDDAADHLPEKQSKRRLNPMAAAYGLEIEDTDED